MKHRSSFLVFERPGPFALLLAFLFLAGCGRKEGETQATADLRGDPIRSPVTATSNSPATASPTNVPQNAVTLPIGEKKVSKDDFLVLGFDKLSGYQFEVTDDILAPTNKFAEITASEKTAGQIPAAVRSLDKKRVALKGFMLPLKVEGGLVTELLIMRDQSMCCYGTVPKINEWVSVKTSGGGVKPIMDEPVTILGTLHVGEIRENGYLVGIYRMDGEKLVTP